MKERIDQNRYTYECEKACLKECIEDHRSIYR